MEIQNISDYLKEIETLSKDMDETGIWFRGQEQSMWELHPSLQRKNLVKKEMELYTLYKQEAVLYINNLHIDDHKAWLESAQHHGVPTRLLDFSTNCLNALYFACQKSKDEDDKNGKVFLFSKTKYLSKLIKENRNINQDYNMAILNNKTELNTNIPVPYSPFYHDFRIALQSSRFLIWGKDERCFEEQLTQEEINIIVPSITIPFKIKESLLEELDKIGVNIKTVYPGLDSLGKYILFKAKKVGKG